MGEHIDNRKFGSKKKKQFNESSEARFGRVSFKNYLKEIENELLEAELDDDEVDLKVQFRRKQD